MKHEFKVTKSKDQTVYTLESASSGGTSSGSVASVSTALGGVQRRPADTIFAQEGSKDKVDASKPRNFVAKNAKMGGAGKMKDKSKTIPRHEKHKKPVAEDVQGKLNIAVLINKEGSSLGISPLKDGSGLWTSRAWNINPAKYGNLIGGRFSAHSNHNAMSNFTGIIQDVKSDPKENNRAVIYFKPDGAEGRGVQVNGKDLNWGQEKAYYSSNEMNEEWSQKYKSSINCSHPKGFSQKAHCAGKKKHEESMMTMEAVCPDCGMCETHGDNMMEVKQRLDAKCWKGYRKAGTKMKGGVRVNNCVPVSEGVEDHEIKMASSELQSIAKNAVHLLDLVRKYSEQEGLQAWQQSKITKAADYLNSVLQSISGEQSGMEEARDNYHANTTGFGRRPRDDERHDLDTQVDPRETMMWNLTVDGKPLNPEPIMGRSNLIKFGKQQAAAGVDLSNAVISPVKEMEEDAYMMELAAKLAEKIPANADVDYYIKDFAKSTAPQFKGKTPAKRKQMAIAAYYGSKQKKK
jgi:hypothetical protein